MLFFQHGSSEVKKQFQVIVIVQRCVTDIDSTVSAPLLYQIANTHKMINAVSEHASTKVIYQRTLENWQQFGFT